MGYFICIVIGFWFACLYPQVLVGAAITIGLLYYCPKVASSLKSATSAGKENEEKRPGFLEDYTDENGVIDWKNFVQDKVKSAMKPDFEKDPEWKEKADRIRKHMKENKKKAEEEDEMERKEEEERKYWAKRDK